MGRLEDTCKEKCNYLKKGQKRENCPNFIQLTFSPLEEHQPYITNDCAPIRTVLMLMDVINSNIGLQKASEQMRNSAENDITVLKRIVMAFGMDVREIMPEHRMLE